MIRLAIVLAAALAAAGCGAELAAAPAPTTTPPKPTTPPPKACRLESEPPPTNAAPSQELLGALAVLRRPATPADALPEHTLRDVVPFLGDMMVDAARVVTPPGGETLWLVPVQNLEPALKLPSAACLRALTPEQRKATRDAVRRTRNRPPVEGIALIGDGPAGLRQLFRTQDVLAGHAFSFQSCTGELHDQVTLTGVVPDGVTQVTVTARSGAIQQFAPEGNVAQFEQPRPDGKAGLPAHITSTTGGAPLEYELDPRITKGLDQPCEPPSRQSIGRPRKAPTKLDAPPGARIELETSRWQPEDSGPLVAGAVQRTGGRRCLLIASEQRLREGGDAHRFCVTDAQLRAKPFVARAARLPSGDVVLEGFADPRRYTWITVERSTVASGAFVLKLSESGAFFVAVRGRHARGGTFKLHVARRGAPVRYTGMTTIRLRRTGG